MGWTTASSRSEFYTVGGSFSYILRRPMFVYLRGPKGEKLPFKPPRRLHPPCLRCRGRCFTAPTCRSARATAVALAPTCEREASSWAQRLKLELRSGQSTSGAPNSSTQFLFTYFRARSGYSVYILGASGKKQCCLVRIEIVAKRGACTFLSCP